MGGISGALGGKSEDFWDAGAVGSGVPGLQFLSKEDQGNFLDPMDLTGDRAAATRNKIRDILVASAEAGVAAQKEMQAKSEEMFKPYYEAGLRSFGDLRSMATGGDLPEGYQPSKLYEYQTEQGNKAITASATKQGLLHSSATDQRRADLASGLAAEEAQRVYGGELSTVQLGTASADSINAASRSLGGNVGSLYSNLGSSLNANTQAYGQARKSSMDSLSNIFAGASSLHAYGGA